VDANNHQAIVSVFFVPLSEKGESPDAVNAAIGPEIDQDNIAA
jgi:hypothetical protein